MPSGYIKRKVWLEAINTSDVVYTEPVLPTSNWLVKQDDSPCLKEHHIVAVTW